MTSLYCDRCGKEIVTPRYVFEVFVFCEYCYEKVKYELKGEKYGEM